MRTFSHLLPLVLFALVGACNKEKAECFEQNVIGACNSLCTGGNEEACAKARAHRHAGCFDKHEAATCEQACMWDEAELACKEAVKLHLQACLDNGSPDACREACVGGEQAACDKQK